MKFNSFTKVQIPSCSKMVVTNKGYYFVVGTVTVPGFRSPQLGYGLSLEELDRRFSRWM